MRTLEQLELDLGHRFGNHGLLEQSLTHSSHAHEQNTGADNEQLEFLGDAILGFVVSDLLFRAHPGLSEGQLSKLKGFFVSSANLVKFAEQLRLGDYLHLGKGEERTGGRAKQTLLVDGFEAILGAVYLDGGLEEARQLIRRLFQPQIDDVGDPVDQVSDFKTALQEHTQAMQMGSVDYLVTRETGPHPQKRFAGDVIVDGRVIASGLALTRKSTGQ